MMRQLGDAIFGRSYGHGDPNRPKSTHVGVIRQRTLQTQRRSAPIESFRIVLSAATILPAPTARLPRSSAWSVTGFRQEE